MKHPETTPPSIPTNFATAPRHKTLEAISKLVVSEGVQSGFRRLKDLGLLDWTIEAAVMKFPDEFSASVRECAVFRLRLARAGVKVA